MLTGSRYISFLLLDISSITKLKLKKTHIHTHTKIGQGVLVKMGMKRHDGIIYPIQINSFQQILIDYRALSKPLDTTRK